MVSMITDEPEVEMNLVDLDDPWAQDVMNNQIESAEDDIQMFTANDEYEMNIEIPKREV